MFSLISKILGPFVNTLTSDKKYFAVKRENLPQSIEIELSNKLKIFSENSTAFLKFTFNLKHFKNKDESHSVCLSEIIDFEIRASVNV